MRKGLIYFLTAFGAFSLFFIILSASLSRTGATMYGSIGPEGGAIPTIATPGNTTPVGMQTGNQPSDSEVRGMIIHNADISLQVENIDKAMDQITQLADRSGGYIVNSSISQLTAAADSTAQISIRVPSQGLNNALTALKALATRVMQESITGEDITQRYISLESRLKNLETAKDQLAKIMAGATKTADVLSVYQELSDTQEQIEIIEGQIKYYKQSVAYSLINISLSLNPATASAAEKHWMLADVARESYHALIDQLRSITYGFIEFIIYFVPLILLWAVVCLIVFWIGRKIYVSFKK
ncbi:hypothetical protein BN59_01005 [Legionella massiliensis]|uniref:DUF4349 domain-containing protein n=1 Tax=Legionella massiliensis TaxID=1034943 RepID=A0A078KQP9_9GAMM|nr:DUF4349 domain-containing protein [Legionella massiliensis]CDZ76730.1 hypothetical protein BN59_01005 [Legionella massiliensis]CEE12468.1 hypothetical protein BN1094_01005 [Legionella massiliensis]